MADQTIATRCCIAGGGPAGIMLGFLLARAGIDVTVLEKWPDFFRDFRGDTIHPSTMEILRELGLLEEFLRLKHNETREIDGYVSGKRIVFADFSHLKGYPHFIAFIPQWDFLNFIAAQAKRYPSFHLMMKTEAVGLIEENGAVTGLHAKSDEGAFTIKADLVVGADGRHSTIREAARLAGKTFGAPMDVLWFRIPRKTSDPSTTLGRIDNGRILILIDRDEYWQCAAIIKKGGMADIQAAGLDAFRKDIINLAPFFADRMQAITKWEDVKLLSVLIDRLDVWHRKGLLCIGDSAHAMSPIAGVGINLAIQDAVAAANLLIPKFRSGVPSADDLAAVEKRRGRPTRQMQSLQIFIQNNIIKRVLTGPRRHYGIPWPVKLIQWFPVLRRIPARIVGVGFRAEHLEV